MILCDANPLVAMIDKSDPDHQRCLSVLPSMKGPPTTTWPCITEAMYLLGRYYGFHYQSALWDMIESGRIEIYVGTKAQQQRMRELMAKYQNVPMDLADASLVAAAEALSIRRVFTLDADFQIYRINDTDAFEIVP